MILRYRPRRAVSGCAEVGGGRAGPKPGRRPPEAVEGSWRIGAADLQPSQAGAGRQQTAGNSPTAAAKAVSNSQPESPSITTNLASSSRSSPTSRPRARRSVPGFPQRVAGPAPRGEHDTVTIAAVVKSGSIDWPAPAEASTEPEPALLQFQEPAPELLGDKQLEDGTEKGEDILGRDIDTGSSKGEEVESPGVMATTSSLTR